MRLHVDSWDPAYGSADATGPGGQSSARLDPDVEVPAGSWRPLVAPGDVRAPDTVLFVDGVRRIDAGVWVGGDDGTTHRGLAASYAAGAVHCDLRRGVAEVAAARIARGLFSACPDAVDVLTGAGSYTAFRVAGDDKLDAGIQAQMEALEVGVATETRTGFDDLLVVDGPLRGRHTLARAVGYIKTHHTAYLDPEQNAMVARLGPGQRTPLFRIGDRRFRWSWYLRLPGANGAPWSGIVRVECSPDLPIEEAVRLAALSVTTLPRFASSAYKDPRAPQNLVPIAGLERRLRGLLGDARVLHRALTLAAAHSR
jgi:hypothetical protein